MIMGLVVYRYHGQTIYFVLPTNGTPLRAVINLKHITEPSSISERQRAAMVGMERGGGCSRNKRAKSNSMNTDSELAQCYRPIGL
jgi:hypothetical protein